MKEKRKRSSINYKHRIRYYEWANRLMRAFIWTLLIWLVRKLIKIPIVTIKKMDYLLNNIIVKIKHVI